VRRVARLIASHPDFTSEAAGAPGVHVLPAGNYGTAELTVLPAGVSKGTALQQVGMQFGIPMQQVLALGDGLNDVSMFRVAGLSVAMGNAPKSLLRTAHAATASNSEDGAARAIERYVLGRLDSRRAVPRCHVQRSRG
jgi:hydroxymethylpyrimidine pyrophosphatase-like HAD family hydrolase